MEFKTPLALVLVPLVILWWWHARRRSDPGTLRFSSTRLVEGVGKTWRTRLAFLPGLLRLVALVLLAVALAGPRQVLEEIQVSSQGVDIVLALDISGSMAAEDFVVNGQRQSRFETVKKVVDEFIKMRPSDQLALVAFAARAYTVCPLTTDKEWLAANLERLRLGLIEDGTAIGAGLASSLARLKDSKAKSKVVVLLTDGVNNAGRIDPIEAARAAAGLGVKVHTIGAGTTGEVPYPRQDVFGRRFYQNVRIDIDEETLKQIAEITGGQSFRATDTDSLREIYKTIDAMEKTRIEQKGYRQHTEVFGVFVLIAMLLILSELMLVNTLLLRIP